jgi:thioredoxin reductase (NADPH)
MYELIIIGAGPAGLTAALYAARAGIKTIILENLTVGGQINLTETIENFPGFGPAISSQDLVNRLEQQIKSLGVEIVQQEAVNIASENDKKIIKTESDEFISQAVIIATGAGPKRLGIPGEDKFTGRGVSYCGVCDAPLFREKRVAVIGGGNSAIEEALHIIKFAKEITLIHRRDKFRADKVLLEQVLKSDKIRSLLDSVVLEIAGTKRVEAIKIKNVKTENNSELVCEGVFIFVGRTPHT